jgi:protein ImuA
MAGKADIISRLKKDILHLEGFKSINNNSVDTGLGPIKYAFPQFVFPTGAIHEFICTKPEEASTSSGFISGILSALMKQGGICIWISTSRTIFPPALKLFGIDPDKIIFIDLKKERDLLWTMEQALKCDGLAAVIGEIKEISFTDSRRLQLAVEQSRVTGFIIRRNPRNLITASVARWKIDPLPSQPEDDMPGVGFPRWKVELIKIRNGKPGSWSVEWRAGRFRHLPIIEIIEEERRTQTG